MCAAVLMCAFCGVRSGRLHRWFCVENLRPLERWSLFGLIVVGVVCYRIFLGISDGCGGCQ